MDFLNIGTGELLFFALLAILLVGPRRAVELMQQAGRFTARVRQEWLSVQQDVVTEIETLRQETLGEIQPALEELQKAKQDMTAEAQALQRRALAEIQPNQEQPPGSRAIPAPAGMVGCGEDKAG
ncbi:MAG TPA: hypothetical protein ENI37_06315 [Chloroflexi bacterium]|nr:hypothetical protein [Chloroflexota bacterium]